MGVVAGRSAARTRSCAWSRARTSRCGTGRPPGVRRPSSPASSCDSTTSPSPFPERSPVAVAVGEQVVDRPGVDDAVRRDAALSARSQPYGCQSSCPGACASVSIENRQPVSTASRSSRRGGSQPLGPGVDLDRDAELPAGLEDHLGVELRLRPRAAPPDDHPAGAVAEDVDVRVGDRGDHPRRHRRAAGIRSLECTDATTTSSRPSSSGSWSRLPSSRMSTSMPVRIRNGASSLVERRRRCRAAAQPLRRQAVGDRQPRRVVGERDVLVAEVARRLGHLLDRRAAVGPVRVRVQVAAQQRAQLGAARRRPARAAVVLELGAGTPAPRRPTASADDLRGRRRRCRASSVSVPAATRCSQPRPSGRSVDGRGRGAERLDPVGRLAAALEQERDPAQRRRRPAPARPHRPGYGRRPSSREAAAVCRTLDKPGRRRDPGCGSVTTGPHGRTVRRLERAISRLAGDAIARMDETLPWYRAMPPRPAVLGRPGRPGRHRRVRRVVPRPRTRARRSPPTSSAPRRASWPGAVTLQQTVELVRITIEVVEDARRRAGRARRRAARCARRCCATPARSPSPPPQVYAQAAEARGAWDARLEALVVDAVLRGEADEAGAVAGRRARLGATRGRGRRRSGTPPTATPEAVVDERPARRPARRARRAQRRAGRPAGRRRSAASTTRVHGGRGAARPVRRRARSSSGPVVADLAAAARSARRGGRRAARRRGLAGRAAAGRRPTTCCPSGRWPATPHARARSWSTRSTARWSTPAATCSRR